MKQVEELKRKLREVEEEKEEIRRGRKEARIGGESRRRKEARGGEYMMRESGAGGIASRAMGSAVHMGQLGIDNNNNDRRSYFPNKQQQSRMVVADVIFFSGAAGQWAGQWALRCTWDCRDRKVTMMDLFLRCSDLRSGFRRTMSRCRCSPCRRYLQQRRRPAVLFSPLRRWGGRPGRPLLTM